MNALVTLGRAVSRLGIAPTPSETPDHRLVELVSGPDRIAPGRALDLGTGAVRHPERLESR